MAGRITGGGKGGMPFLHRASDLVQCEAEFYHLTGPGLMLGPLAPPTMHVASHDYF
jgi:hypothetical protein